MVLPLPLGHRIIWSFWAPFPLATGKLQLLPAFPENQWWVLSCLEPPPSLCECRWPGLSE